MRADADQDGQAIALMNADIDGLLCMPEMLHETWAQTVEVLIGIAILTTVVGWLWPIAIFLIFGMSAYNRRGTGCFVWS